MIDEGEMHRQKYARVERERRFLVRALPAQPAERVRHLVDRYLPGTRLRLRLITEASRDGEEHLFKLTQKIPADGLASDRPRITSTYLSESEYGLLAKLPASVLRKTRYSIPPMGVDVFEPPLDGLIMAEAEFDSDEEEAAFQPPPYAIAEVTDDPRLTGGRLIRTSRAELVSWLREYGLSPEGIAER